MEHRPPRRTRPLAAAALFALPLGGALLLLQALPQGGPPRRAWQPGPVGAADLRWQPVALPDLRAYGLSLVSRRGRIVAGEAHPGPDPGGPALWSGPPPAFSLRAAGRPGSARGAAGRVDVEGTVGTVTLADAHGRTRDVLPVLLISVRESGGDLGGGSHSWVITPEGRLTRAGTLRLTYRDTAGRVVGRATVSR